MTILNIDANSAIQISLESTIGEKIAILGIAGSGKSNSSAVILEEFLSNALPVTIVDIEGEYWGLKERFDIVIIGRSANVDVEVDASNAAQFAAYSVEHGVSMILDLADYDSLEDMHDFLIAYFEALWVAASKARRPYVVVLEEAHEFIPQGASTPIKKLLTTFALRGRKRGIGMIVISQRSAKVEKSVLTQASIVILHRVVHPTDLKVYQDIVPLPSRIVEERVGALKKGDALVIVEHTVHTARIRLRHTYHAGATPELDATQRTHLRRADDSVLAELRKLVTAPPDEDSKSGDKEIERLRGDLTRRDGTITAHKAEIARLNGEVERLTKEAARWKQAAERVASPATQQPQSMPSTPKRPAVLSPSPDPAPARGTVERAALSQAAQQRRFNALLNDLYRLPRYKRDILVYLIEREGTLFTVKQLAKALILSPKTISDHPPLDVIEMGLLKRNGIPGQFVYSANTRAKLREMFPDFNVEEMLDRIIKRLK